MDTILRPASRLGKMSPPGDYRKLVRQWIFARLCLVRVQVRCEHCGVKSFAVLAAFLATLLVGCEKSSTSMQMPAVVSTATEARLGADAVCLRDADKLIAHADALIEVGKFDAARKSVLDCRVLLGPSATPFDVVFDRAAVAEAKGALASLPKSDWEARLKRLREIRAANGSLDTTQAKELSALEAKDASVAKQRAAIQNAVSSLKYYPLCNELGRAARASAPSLRDGAILNRAETAYDVRASDLSAIRAKRIEVGMSMCAVVAVMGIPSEVKEVQTVGSKGWSVWYSGQGALIYLNAGERVISFTR